MQEGYCHGLVEWFIVLQSACFFPERWKNWPVKHCILACCVLDMCIHSFDVSCVGSKLF